MSEYDEVPPAEHEDRLARILSVPCPKCGTPAGRLCVSPHGSRQPEQHGARWDAWYAAHREASAS